jgi:hypothetical protein
VQLTDFALVRGLLILAAGFQAALPGGHGRLHPRLDLGVLQIVLAAGIDELPPP